MARERAGRWTGLAMQSVPKELIMVCTVSKEGPGPKTFQLIRVDSPDPSQAVCKALERVVTNTNGAKTVDKGMCELITAVGECPRLAALAQSPQTLP